MPLPVSDKGSSSFPLPLSFPLPPQPSGTREARGQDLPHTKVRGQSVRTNEVSTATRRPIQPTPIAASIALSGVAQFSPSPSQNHSLRACVAVSRTHAGRFPAAPEGWRAVCVGTWYTTSYAHGRRKTFHSSSTLVTRACGDKSEKKGGHIKLCFY